MRGSQAFALGMKQGDVYGILLQQLLDQAVAAGFKPRKEGRGGHGEARTA